MTDGMVIIANASCEWHKHRPALILIDYTRKHNLQRQGHAVVAQSKAVSHLSTLQARHPDLDDTSRTGHGRSFGTRNDQTHQRSNELFPLVLGSFTEDTSPHNCFNGGVKPLSTTV